LRLLRRQIANFLFRISTGIKLLLHRLCDHERDAGLILPVALSTPRGEVGGDTVRMQGDARGIERQVISVERGSAGEVVRLKDSTVRPATVGARYQRCRLVIARTPLFCRNIRNIIDIEGIFGFFIRNIGIACCG
jgi:hypothetical protein